jgi:hypothetical protein
LPSSVGFSAARGESVNVLKRLAGGLVDTAALSEHVDKLTNLIVHPACLLLLLLLLLHSGEQPVAKLSIW